MCNFDGGHYYKPFCEIKFGPVPKEEISFKDISTFSSGRHFVLQSGNVCAIFVKGIVRNIHVK